MENEIKLSEIINQIKNPRTYPFIIFPNHDSVTYNGSKPKGVSDVFSPYLWEISVFFADPIDLNLLKEIAAKKDYKTKNRHFDSYEYASEYDQKGNPIRKERSKEFDLFSVLSKMRQGRRSLTQVYSYDPNTASVRIRLGSSAFGRFVDKKSVELLEDYIKEKYN